MYFLILVSLFSLNSFCAGDIDTEQYEDFSGYEIPSPEELYYKIVQAIRAKDLKALKYVLDSTDKETLHDFFELEIGKPSDQFKGLRNYEILQELNNSQFSKGFTFLLYYAIRNGGYFPCVDFVTTFLINSNTNFETAISNLDMISNLAKQLERVSHGGFSRNRYLQRVLIFYLQRYLYISKNPTIDTILKTERDTLGIIAHLFITLGIGLPAGSTLSADLNQAIFEAGTKGITVLALRAHANGPVKDHYVDCKSFLGKTYITLRSVFRLLPRNRF